MSDFRQRFDPAEVGAEVGSVELIDTARDLEAYADVGWSGPAATFEDRVMAALAAEPAPRLLAALGPMATLRQAWRLAWSGGRPIAVRAQAIALVLVAVVAVGAVGSLGVIAGSRLVSPEIPPPPTTQPTPSPSPSPSPSLSVSPSPSPRVSPSPTMTPRPSPTETDQPTGTGDHGGGSGGSGGSGGDSSGPGSGDSGSDSSGPGSGGANNHSGSG